MKGRRRRKSSPKAHADTEGSWAISYGDMITLLLAFFVLFFSVDKSEEEKALNRAEELTQFLVAHLNDGTESVRSQGLRAPAGGDSTAANPPLIVRGPIAEENREQQQVHYLGRKVIVEFPSVSFFNSGGLDITREGDKALSDFVEKFLPYAGQFMLSIRAFTDPRPVRLIPGRRFHDNLELSALRSIAAMRSLQKGGIPLNRMRLSGHGEHLATVADLVKIKDARDSTELRHALSRKIVLVLTPGGSS